MRRLHAVLASALVLAAPIAGMVPASAVVMGSAPAEASVGDISVADGFARAMPDGSANGTGYVTITNRGSGNDRLIAVSSPSSRMVDVHEMVMGGGTMEMRPFAQPLEIQPGRTVKLQPQGDLHLMFVGVNRPFAEGSEVSVTLTFEKAGPIALKLPVLAATADAPPVGTPQ